MRVVHLAVKASGGAGIAAGRTVAALRGRGVDAELWTNDGEGATRRLRSRLWALWRARLASIPTRLHKRRRLFSAWSNGWLPSRLAATVASARPDIVHLHWIGDGFLHLDEVARFGAPVVWTLHDAWGITGGCHYPANCERFRIGCGSCPQLGSTSDRDLSSRNHESKRLAAKSISRWIMPSQWLAELSSGSGVVPRERVRVIPYGVDETVFTSGIGINLRSRLGIPGDVLVLAAGAEDLREGRKGAWMLPKAIALVQESLKKRCILVVFGKSSELLRGHRGVEVRHAGELRTEREVAGVLGGADALLLPSLQDNLPNIAIEAQACGCPVVGFDTGGQSEIIVSGQTGLLSADVSVEGLAGAVVNWFCSAPARAEVVARCRAQFESRFTYERHSTQLLSVYREILK